MASNSITRNKTLLFIFFLLTLTTIFPQSRNVSFFDNLIQEYDIPGLSIGFIKDGEVSFLSHHGVTANDTKDPVRLNTVFVAASLSKPTFAYAVLKLEKQGKIDLDKPVYQYLENKDLMKDERYKQITTRMLLSHSSGLPNWRRRNGELKLMHNPGSKFQYSGEGYMYLAKVVEHIMQKPVNEVMKELVFKPLGMTHSSYIWEKRFETNYASPHDYTGTAKPKRHTTKPVIASSLHTTVSDYTKLMLAVLQKKGLKRSSYKAIINPQIKINDSLGWGLGWGIQKSSNNKYLWQWGDNGTYKGFVMMYPKEKNGVIFLVNSYKGLRILPKLVDYLFNDVVPEFSMLKSSMNTRNDEKLLLSILNKGYDEGIKNFLSPNSNKIDSTLITKRHLASVAMQLRWRNKFYEVKSLLKIIAHTYTKSSKAQKNYADNCIKHGLINEGIQYYKKALSLEPKNESVSNTIHLLTSKKLTGNVTFVFSDYLWGDSVFVSGSFNKWSYSSIPMLKKNGVWTTTIQLEPGEYSYQFIVNGYPMLDPRNDNNIKKENGEFNSVLKVNK